MGSNTNSSQPEKTVYWCFFLAHNYGWTTSRAVVSAPNVSSNICAFVYFVCTKLFTTGSTSWLAHIILNAFSRFSPWVTIHRSSSIKFRDPILFVYGSNKFWRRAPRIKRVRFLFHNRGCALWNQRIVNRLINLRNKLDFGIWLLSG